MNEKYNKLKEILGPEKFTDEEFSIKSTENNPWLKGDKKWNEDGNLVPKTLDDLKFDRPVYGKFLQDSHSAQDILQGQIGMNSFKGPEYMIQILGDCWFLAAVAAVAEERHRIDKVIMPEFNETETAKELGLYRFRFFDLDWYDVIIDDVLAKGYVAEPAKNEYWVPLIEKAYAKFHGNYETLIGGFSLNGLYNLTGGLTIGLSKEDSEGPSAYWSTDEVNGFDLFEFLMKNQEDAIYCSGNSITAAENIARDIAGKTETADKNGLIAPHAYSFLQLAKVHLK